MSSSSELDRIRLLSSIFGAPGPNFQVGIGDDCAVLAPGAGRLVWSIDASVEGTHFRRDLMTLKDAGYKATMAALSDLAAMGATPLGVVGALTLPASLPDDDFEALVSGQQEAAASTGTTFVGGNLARGDSISITTSVLGTAERPVLRSGAAPMDAVFLAGPLGLAAAGLALAGRPASQAVPSVATIALQAFRRPRALLSKGLAAARSGATSLIDVSDGLASDAAHVAQASGVTIVFDEALLIPAAHPELAALATLVGRDPLDLVLAGGEDYALLATAPAGIALPGFTCVGRCAPRGAAPLYLASRSSLKPIEASGFDHFASLVPRSHDGE